MSKKLLTHDQLVDWLIYHVPPQNNVRDDVFPCTIHYQPQTSYLLLSFRVKHYDPIKAYSELATVIVRSPAVHQEITELYWYWTTY